MMTRKYSLREIIVAVVVGLVSGAIAANGFATKEVLDGQRKYFVQDCHKKVEKAKEETEKQMLPWPW